MKVVLAIFAIVLFASGAFAGTENKGQVNILDEWNSDKFTKFAAENIANVPKFLSGLKLQLPKNLFNNDKIGHEEGGKILRDNFVSIANQVGNGFMKAVSDFDAKEKKAGH